MASVIIVPPADISPITGVVTEAVPKKYLHTPTVYYDEVYVKNGVLMVKHGTREDYEEFFRETGNWSLTQSEDRDRPLDLSLYDLDFSKIPKPIEEKYHYEAKEKKGVSARKQSVKSRAVAKEYEVWIGDGVPQEVKVVNSKGVYQKKRPKNSRKSLVVAKK